MASRNSLKSLVLAASAALVVAGAATPAAAGGRGHGYGYGHGYHGGGYYGGDWRYDGYRGAWNDGYRNHHRHYRYKRHKGGLSGAEAGLIAAGIVGAAILIDSASDRRRDVRPYDDEGYDRRYRDYGRYDGRYDRRADVRYWRDDDFYYRRDDRRLTDREWNDSLDDRLEGGDRAKPGEYNYGAAYIDCKAETREAARREGLTVGLPAKPDRIQRIEDGEAVRFVTTFEMDEGRGRNVKQTMVCEADAAGVRFLELV
jgi:hypothetical protein